MEKQLDILIENLDDAVSYSGFNVAKIEATIRVLELIKNLNGNIVGLSDEDFESMITEAIKG